MDKFDVIVIGAGPGGYVAAIRAAELGLKTAIIEKDSLGGVCLNVGCIPSKSLLKNAEVARMLRKETETFGVTLNGLELDYSKAVERSRKVSKRLNQGIAFLMKKNNITVYEGAASFISEHKLLIILKSGESLELQADHVIIAAGSHSTPLKGMEPDGEKILNYRQAILQTTRPDSIVIIGGGAIGVEFATIWRAYGTEVTVVEMMDQLLPNEDPEAGKDLEKSFKKQGMKVLTGTKLESVDKTDQGVTVHVSDSKGKSDLSADQVLIAVGFAPSSAALNLPAAGVKTSDRGWIETDLYGKTNIDSIYAVGDVAGRILLAHTASAMGRIAAEKIAGREPKPFNLDLIPHTTFSFPQVASFGLTEAEAIKRGLKVKSGKALFLANGKALGMNEYEGWAKLVCDADSHVLLGAVMLGPEVSELLPELTLAAANQLTVEDILTNVHAHPTLSEIISDAAENLLNS